MPRYPRYPRYLLPRITFATDDTVPPHPAGIADATADAFKPTKPKTARLYQMSENPNHNTELKIPDVPRFTLSALREILIPEGGTDSTLARYKFRHRGRTVEKIARFDDLTETERTAALVFMLRHGAGLRIRRKNTPPSLDVLPEFEPLPDDLLKDVDETDTQGNTETRTPTGQEGTPTSEI